LGKLFFGVHLTDDQAYVLDKLVDLIADAKPDGLIVAGDVYDRAVPPPEAVRLLDAFVSRVALELRAPMIFIAGNHDSPGRFGFGSRVMAQTGVHLTASIEPQPACVTLNDAWGPVHFYAIPYAEALEIREKTGQDSVQDQQTAMIALIERIWQAHPAGERAVLIAHAFAGGGEASDSERPLSVGGADRVAADCFRGFHYVALGHLHRPQTLEPNRLHYPGSLMKYSFAEENQQKGVSLVEMDGAGGCCVEAVALTPRRDVRRIEGFLSDILANPMKDKDQEDYLAVSLLDTDAILDVKAKLEQVYPNVLHVERPHLLRRSDLGQPRPDHRKLNDAELFAAFFSEVTAAAASEAELSAYESIVDELRRIERESVQ
jgi:exonuclease SbcD